MGNRVVVIEKGCISDHREDKLIESLQSAFRVVFFDKEKDGERERIEKICDGEELDRGHSFFLGEHPSEVEWAKDAGFFGLYILSGKGARGLKSLHADIPVFHFLSDALDWILRDEHPLETMKREIENGARAIRQGGWPLFPLKPFMVLAPTLSIPRR